MKNRQPFLQDLVDRIVSPNSFEAIVAVCLTSAILTLLTGRLAMIGITAFKIKIILAIAAIPVFIGSIKIERVINHFVKEKSPAIEKSIASIISVIVSFAKKEKFPVSIGNSFREEEKKEKQEFKEKKRKKEKEDR